MVPSNFQMPDWDIRLVKEIGGRRVRQYFPRSRTALVETYDFLLFEDTWLECYRPEQVGDMGYAIEKKGLGALVTMGNSLSGPTAFGWYGWQQSVLEKLMPIELTQEMSTSPSARYAGFRIKILTDDPPVLGMFRQFGIENVAGTGNAWLKPRLGSTTWADMAHSYSSPTGSKAWLVSWKTGDQGSHFWIDADNLFSTWWDPYNNEYAPDVLLNILLHSTGRELPEDIVIIHTIRRQYWLYTQHSSYLQSLFVFVERLGANTLKLADQLNQIDQDREESFGQFRNQQYGEALATIRSTIDQFDDLEKKTFKLKDATLVWVYLIEWATVTSVIMISGVVLWLFMVRRRLFREVSATRLAQDQSIGDC